MSINPLQSVSLAENPYYDPDINGPRKFIVETTRRNLQIIQQAHETKYHFIMVDIPTVKITKITPVMVRGDEQEVIVDYSYKNYLGRPLTGRSISKRYNLHGVLSRHLTTVEDVMDLSVSDRSIFGILLAIRSATNVNIGPDDVMLSEVVNNQMTMYALKDSVGWYGEAVFNLVSN
jgi:hypothetical protein